MPLVVELVLIVIGLALLALALIGSGISRRLMTIPKMHRTPRIVLAILGVLLLAGGMWGMSVESEKRGPSLDDLRAHIPPDVKTTMACAEATESPKGAVEMDCSTPSGVPEAVYYIMFPDVNSMQDYWMKQSASESQPASECSTIEHYKNGGKGTYFFNDKSVIIGDYSCFASGDDMIAVYTDRRYNVAVYASVSDAKRFPEFLTWVNTTSQPVGDADATPATPSFPAAAGR
ncbi:hypothetical protein [Streptomyces sp. NPDC057686]|uniref:hypothetical protein n=1 Tax=Streptomyces sp. NPDC057686 TaxID=3346212 RepID=UPI0036A8EC53